MLADSFVKTIFLTRMGINSETSKQLQLLQISMLLFHVLYEDDEQSSLSIQGDHSG